MKSFLLTWLALITLTVGLICRDKTLGTTLLIASGVLIWLAGS